MRSMNTQRKLNKFKEELAANLPFLNNMKNFITKE